MTSGGGWLQGPALGGNKYGQTNTHTDKVNTEATLIACTQQGGVVQ